MWNRVVERSERRESAESESLSVDLASVVVLYHPLSYIQPCILPTLSQTSFWPHGLQKANRAVSPMPFGCGYYTLPSATAPVIEYYLSVIGGGGAQGGSCFAY